MMTDETLCKKPTDPGLKVFGKRHMRVKQEVK